MKKLINAPKSVVRETLEGLVDLSSHLALLEGETVVTLRDPGPGETRPVAVISGGGSGHEPAHAGYVGRGMLSAAVAGDVFTSPSVDAVLAAILAVSGPAGAVLIVKNYTGDRLNFSLAAELAQAQGVPVEVVIVADDIALRDTVARDRWRGIAGTVLIHRIAGAAAAQGLPLSEVSRLAWAAAAEVTTMGVGLGSCTVPAAGKPGFTLGESEIEFGLGIHGEKGVSREPMAPADQIVDRLIEAVTIPLAGRTDRPVALLVNGLGGTPPIELAIVARHAIARLRTMGLRVERAWAGTFMSALEMPGVSLSLLPLDSERSACLDTPTEALNWPGPGLVAEKKILPAPAPEQTAAVVPDGPLAPILRQVVNTVAEALRAAEDHLTDLDAQAGDGDLGASLARGAEALKALPAPASATPEILLAAAAGALRSAIAGSSGPFYATGLMRASRAIAGIEAPSPAEWCTAFRVAVDAVREIGGAKPGDRTMVDALHPAVEALTKALQRGEPGALEAALEAAKAGATATREMRPALGRASYLGDRALGVPDGGAVAVTIWLGAICEALRRR
ncbi:dihydroxyacetone kinase family protein [Thioclava sp. BHET1]|nr:dihydroxyacetone kinase family protein [Thioclava sp. BHET1]